MYLEYWKLKQKPFSNTPNPAFYYHSKQHEDALAKLFYAVSENSGAAMLTGTYGCGKTLLSRMLFAQIANTASPFVCNALPDISSIDLLRMIARTLGGQNSVPATRADIVTDALMETVEHALASHSANGRHVVLLVDEAHLITHPFSWEMLRLLLNFHNEESYLLTLILSGHPELAHQVEEIPQLAQRIAVTAMLGPFDHADTTGYIQKRLSVAGAEKQIFKDEAIRVIHQLSDGIPRRINRVCSSALAMGTTRQLEDIDASTVMEAAKKFAIV